MQSAILHTKQRKASLNAKFGFSLIEIVVVIAIMAIIAALLVPALIHYTEDSRAQKDVTTMDEVVNAVQLALADPDCFDEMELYSCDNNFITYSDSSGKYGAQVVDAEYWAPDGCGKATTITFNPEKSPNGETIYRLENAVINDMTYGNGSVGQNRIMIGENVSNSQCYFPNAKLKESQEIGHTYAALRQVFGGSIVTTSATYANSSFTIFIKFNNKDGVSSAVVDGSFNGTNLDASSQSSVGTGTTEYEDDDNKEQSAITTLGGGTQNATHTNSSLIGAGTIAGNTSDYKNNDTIKGEDGYISRDSLAMLVKHTNPKSIIFTNTGRENGFDVSEEQNQSIYAWMEGDTCYISMRIPNKKVMTKSYWRFFDGYLCKPYENISYLSVEHLDIVDGHSGDMTGMFARVGHESDSITIDHLDTIDIAEFNNLYGVFHELGGNASEINLIGIENWDTSNITNMSYVFKNMGQEKTQIIDIDVSKWDTSNVTTMKNMFALCGVNAKSFSVGDLSNWDTSKVQDMGYMFGNAGEKATEWYIGDISDWNVGNVKTMSAMFYGVATNAETWTIDVSAWDMKNCENINQMFYFAGKNAKNWSIGQLDNWDVSKVKTAQLIAYGAGSKCTSWTLGDLSAWNTSNLEDAYYMFYNTGYSAKNYTLGDLSNWDMSKCKTMYAMFSIAGYNAETFNIGDIGKWNISNCTTIERLFESAGYAKAKSFYVGDLSNWNTSKITNMNAVFNGTARYATYNVGDLTKWDVNAVTTHDKFDNNNKVIDPLWKN